MKCASAHLGRCRIILYSTLKVSLQINKEVTNMYAIALIAGKQYKVSVGDVVRVDRLNNEVGTQVEFPVLMTADENNIVAGNPVVKDVVVKAKVESHTLGNKIVVFKYKAKKNERKKQGHRQAYTNIVIESIG